MSKTKVTINTVPAVSTLSLLGIAFVVLKLCGVINWSWWFVTMPFWIGIPLFLLGILMFLGLLCLIALFVK